MNLALMCAHMRHGWRYWTCPPTVSFSEEQLQRAPLRWALPPVVLVRSRWILLEMHLVKKTVTSAFLHTLFFCVESKRYWNGFLLLIASNILILCMANVPLAKAKFPTEAHLINNFHTVQCELQAVKVRRRIPSRASKVYCGQHSMRRLLFLP